MKLIQSFEDALHYANRLGLAGDPKTTVMQHKQENLVYYVDQMIKACGQYRQGVQAVDHWPLIPFVAHWNRSTRSFTATVLGPGQNTSMVKRAKREAKKKLKAGNK